MADFLERIGTTTTVTKNITTTIRSSSGSVVTERKTQTKELDLPTSISTNEQSSKSTTIITRKSTGSSLISNPSIEKSGNSNESSSPVARFLSRVSSTYSVNISPSTDTSGVLSFLQDHLQELKDLKEAIGTVLSEAPSHLPPEALSSSSGFNVSAVQSPIRHSEISKVKNLLRAPSPPPKSKLKSKDEDDDDEDDEADEDGDDDDDEDVDDDGDDDEDDSKVIYIDDEAPGESSRTSLHSHAINDVATWISLKVESIESYLVKLHETVGTNSHSTPISSSRGAGSRVRPQSLFLPLPLSASQQTDSNRGEEEGEEEGGFFVDDDGDDSFDEDALFNEDLEGEDFESDTEGEVKEGAGVGKGEEEGKGEITPEPVSAPTVTAETTITTTEPITTTENKEKAKEEEGDLKKRQGAFIKRQPSGTGPRAFPPLPPPPTTTPLPTYSPSTPSPKVQAASSTSTPVAAAPATSALQWLLMNPQAPKTSARPTTPRRGGTMSRATRLEMEKELEAKTKQQRLNVFKEVLSTEREYVNSLQLVIDIYLKPIRDNKAVVPNMPPGTSLLTSEEIQSMFANIEEVWQVSNTLVTAFEEVNRNIIREPQSEHFILLAEAFVGNQEKLLRAYTPYVGNHQVAFTTYQILLADPTRPFFAAFVKVRGKTKARGTRGGSEQGVKFFFFPLQLAERNPKCKFMDLLGFLIKPVQRICKYPLLFKEMAKNSRTTDMEYESLLKAQRAAEAITNDVNELKRLSENMSQLIQLQSTILGCRVRRTSPIPSSFSVFTCCDLTQSSSLLRTSNLSHQHGN
jgi:hypothetical protein